MKNNQYITERIQLAKQKRGITYKSIARTAGVCSEKIRLLAIGYYTKEQPADITKRIDLAITELILSGRK